MKTLTITLKQHTPLIHFQHSQKGATLRATEVKPKLDRFVLTALGNGNYGSGLEEAKKKGWLIGKKCEHPALNYKIRIESEGDREDFLICSYLSNAKIEYLNEKGIKVLSPTPYFAQEKENGIIAKDTKKWNDIKCKGIIYSCTKVYILSLSNQIIDCIQNYIQSFFIANNFGTRQNKGFGSYTVTEIIKEEGNSNRINIKLKDEESLIKDNFSIHYKKIINSNNINTIFSSITNDYRLIKSGRNKPYAKSKLMLYGLQSKIRWEKKFFKDYVDDCYENENEETYKLKNKFNKSSNSINDDEKYYYLRALLGLAGQYEFLLENPPTDKSKLIITVKSENVERFKSPIFFKVIGNTIYLLANEITADILKQKFSFFVNIQDDDYYIDDELDDTLFTPDRFNIKDFLHFALVTSDKNKELNYTGF